MRTITNELSIGKTGRGLDMYCQVGLSGQTLYRMKCESLVGNFVRSIYLFMSMRRDFERFDWNYGYNPSAVTTISYVNGDQDLRVGANGGTYIFGSDSNIILLLGVEGIPEINGIWYRNDASKNPYGLEIARRDYEYFDILGAGTLFPDRQYIADSGWINDGRLVTESINQLVPGRFWKPVVGTGSEPVKATDMVLKGLLRSGFSNGATTIAPLITDQQSSKFNLSRSFTNMREYPVDVSEIGIETDYANNSRYELMARDLLGAPVTVAHGKTLTLDYEVRTDIENFSQDTVANGSNGGFLEKFLSSVRDNATHSTSNWYDQIYRLLVCYGGGWCKAGHHDETSFGWQYGIRLGSSNKFVSMTDTSLAPADDTNNGYSHGDSDGTLYHHGTSIGELAIDDQTNQAWFPIERIFENRGSVALPVREIGLFANGDESYTNPSPALIARTALDPNDEFTIGAGEIVRVVYTVKAII